MTEIKQIYKCNICGNIVTVLHKGAGQLVCCNQPMELLAEKNQEEGFEKHLPVIDKKGDSIKVKVGEVAHPMEENHFIELIEITVDGVSYLKFLKPGDAPEMAITVKGEKISARIFCNVHGLWANNRVIVTESNDISFEEFERVQLRIAQVVEASEVEGSEKLIRLKVLLGEEERQILAGIRKYYLPENLVNKKIVIVANLEPRMIFGSESQGMVLAAKDKESDSLSVVVLEKDIASGTRLS
jgi:superoxide reductase